MNTGEPVALKMFERNLEGKALFGNESKVHAGLVHPNIPRCLGVGRMAGKYFLAIQYLPYPNLNKFTRERGGLSESDALFVLKQLVRFAICPTFLLPPSLPFSSPLQYSNLSPSSP